MYTLSSDVDFNQTILNLKTDERKAKTGGFTFIQAPASRMNRFIKKFGLSPIKTSSGAAGQEIDTNEKEEKEEDN